MSGDDGRAKRPLPLPAHFTLDALTRYVYRHFPELLTEEELAAERVMWIRGQQLCSSIPDGTQYIGRFGVPELEKRFPELMRRIEAEGFAVVMRAAADRVLRENPEKKILQLCPRCGGLCLTPRAKWCPGCGYCWRGEAE